MSELSELDRLMQQQGMFTSDFEGLSEIEKLMQQQGMLDTGEVAEDVTEPVVPKKDPYERSKIEILMEQQGITPTKEGTTIHRPDGSEAVRLIDQDTGVLTDGTVVRYSGIAAPETVHRRDEDFTNTWGEIGGETATLLGEKAIREEGFYNKALTGEQGFFGRELGTMASDGGQSYSKFLLRSGAGYLSTYANDDDVSTSLFGSLDKARRKSEGKYTEWDRLVDAHNDHVSQGAVSMKPLALNEQMYAAAPDLYAGVAIRSNDRTIMNETTDWQLGQAFGQGIDHGLVGAATAVGMIEESFGVDSIDNWGLGQADAIKREIEDAPYMRDMTAFDKNGNWTLDGVSEFTNYAFSNLLTSLPVMSVGIAAVLAIPATWGASLAVPTAIYAGGNYDEQDVKDKSDAILGAMAMTSLDVLGVKLGFAFKPTNAMAVRMATKEGREGIINEVAKTSLKSAAKVRRLMKESIQETSGAAAMQLKLLLDGTSSMLVRSGRVGIEGLKGMSAEGITEAMQEYIAIQAEGNNITPEEMLNRLLNAGFAGGVLGGGMSITGTATSGLANAQVRAGLSTAENATTSSTTRALDMDKEAYGKPLSVDEVIVATEHRPPVATTVDDDTRGANLEGQTNGERKGEPKGRVDKIMGSIPGLVRGQLKDTLNRFQSTRYMSMLGSILGVNNARGGLGFEDERRKKVADYTGKKSFDGLRTSTRAGHSGTKSFSEKMYKNREQIENILSKVKNKEQLTRALTKSGLNFNAEEMLFWESVYDTDGDIRDSSEDTHTVIDKTISRHKVHKNEDKLAYLLADKLGISKAEAKKAIILFVQNDQYASPLDVLGLSEADSNAALNKMLDVNRNATIEDTFNLLGASEYLDSNIFNNIINNGSRAANRQTHDKFLGKDGDKLANILDLALERGEITPEEKIQVASKLKDYMDQISGDYHRIDSKFYRNSINNLGFLTAITALPLAAISSLVEIGFVVFQNNPKPMQTTFVLAKVAVQEMKATMNEGLAVLTRGKIPMAEYTHRDMLRTGGYLLDAQAPAARQGAEVSPRQAGGLGVFFKASGLTGLTNIQRYARMAMAEDTVNHWVAQAMTHEPAPGEPINRFHAEALEQLGNLGVQPEILINAHKGFKADVDSGKHARDPASTTHWFEDEVFLDQLENAKIKFVDMAIAMPQVGNRPAFYNDPRYRLFTQFQGYISTATANLLPIMYNNMGGKEKMPIARVNAIATLASLIAISMYAQAMKDAVKTAFADDEAKERKDEYLGSWQKFMRGIYGSGVLGVAERPLDFMIPLYGNRPTATGNALDMTGIPFAKGIADNVISEAPGLSYMDNVFKATHGIATQDKNALRNTIKVAPMLQPFGDWFTTYKGE